ncbi:protein LAX PANICLE 2-like isoform X1 [Vitis riparia]|uniref:protein LAX PANICLE 2-like isoform X1 n=1 Tax=Vitis riparia TaxID=96939 RepID=UPI00155A5ED5|nr:protein LAX PANICLE 2-like isoform X1 [Vitis riparia]
MHTDLHLHMDDHEKGENGEGEWLELGLGFTRSTFSSSSSLGLGLGLGLGFGVTPSINYDPLVPSSLTWFSASPPPPSSPPSPWPWPMVSAGGLLRDRQTPVTRSSTGLWFTLVSSINRNGEVLPQVPKAYIRVREENVTVLMVQKYLVTKLGLSNEAEIDISCMGEKLLQWQTLRHVWDSVWLPRIIESENSTAALVGNPGGHRSTNYLMSLQYGRRCFFN